LPGIKEKLPAWLQKGGQFLPVVGIRERQPLNQQVVGARIIVSAIAFPQQGFLTRGVLI